jgi:hypothetical protein
MAKHMLKIIYLEKSKRFIILNRGGIKLKMVGFVDDRFG